MVVVPRRVTLASLPALTTAVRPAASLEGIKAIIEKTLPPLRCAGK